MGILMSIESEEIKRLEFIIKLVEKELTNCRVALVLANNRTKQIKHSEDASNIYLDVVQKCVDAGMNENDFYYNLEEVRRASNKLESAIFRMVEPIEEKISFYENKIEEHEDRIEAIETEGLLPDKYQSISRDNADYFVVDDDEQ